MIDDSTPADPEGAQPDSTTHAEPAGSTAEALSPDAYKQKLEELAGGSAKLKKFIDQLGKLMSKGTSDGVQLPPLSQLDPSNTKRMNDFLTKPNYADARKILKARVATWIKALEAGKDLDDVHEHASERLDKVDELLNDNLRSVFEQIRPLEKSYRQVDGFFANADTGSGDPVDAWFFNASAENLLDNDDRSLFEALQDKIRSEYKFFTKRDVYSTLLVPEWTGSVGTVDRLGELGERFDMQVYTDADDYEDFQQLKDDIEVGYQGLRSSESQKRYVAMAGNYVLGRGRHDFEEEDLYISPSALLAGGIYKLDDEEGPHESKAGYRKGVLQGPSKVRFRVGQDEAGAMKDLGIIPTSFVDSKVRVMGDWNLNDKEGQDTYARIRTEDWITKNVCHYLNKQTFENITDGLLNAMERDLNKFLLTCVGETKPLETAKATCRASPEQRTKHEVDVTLTLGFKQAVHTFNVFVRPDDAGNPNAQPE